MRILITGAGALLGQGIIQSLLKSGLQGVQIIAADPSPLSAGLYWTNERYLLPKATDPGFLETLCRLIEAVRPDLIIPGTDVELLLLAHNRERLEETYGVKVLVSSPNVVEIADDKYKTFKFFRDNGFPAPDSSLPGGELELVQRVGFPLIVKPRTGARSIGVRKVHNTIELEDAIRSTNDPVIQECVGTDDAEYTAGAVFFDGGNQASIVMRRDLRDGNTYRAYVENSHELNVQIQTYAARLEPFGPVNFQFRISEGQIKVFEINGRFSGTTPLRMLAGFNEVEICVRYLLNHEPVVQPHINEMTILRHWSETVILPNTPQPLSV